MNRLVRMPGKNLPAVESCAVNFMVSKEACFCNFYLLSVAFEVMV